MSNNRLSPDWQPEHIPTNRLQVYTDDELLAHKMDRCRARYCIICYDMCKDIIITNDNRWLYEDMIDEYGLIDR